jgi:hypothetical protein
MFADKQKLFSNREKTLTRGEGWDKNLANGSDDARNVGCLEALGAFTKIELDGLSFIQRAVTVFLDGGIMDEDIFPRRALDEAVSFRSVEPLDCAFFSTH